MRTPHLTEEAFAFERIFIQKVLDLAKKKGFSIASFAQTAFPPGYKSDPVRRSRTILSKNRLGKPQKINLTDAYLMSKALGMELPYLMLIACQGIMDEMEGQGDDNSEQETF